MGKTYSRVYGRLIAYQQTCLFILGRTLEQHYLDGVSITHGSAGSRQHVRSLASALGGAIDCQEFSCRNNWPYSLEMITGNHGGSPPFVLRYRVYLYWGPNDSGHPKNND